MLELIGIYVKRLAVFVIFSSFISILLPNNDYRGYVRLIMGMILIFIMLQPIQSIVTGCGDIVFNKDYELSKAITESEMKVYTDKQKELILLQFKNDIEEQISNTVSEYGQVIEVDVEVKNFDDNLTLEVINLRVEAYNDENTTINNIKKVLSDFYKLSEDNINITIL